MSTKIDKYSTFNINIYLLYYWIVVSLVTLSFVGCVSNKTVSRSRGYRIPPPSGVYLITTNPEGASFTLYDWSNQPVKEPLFTDYSIYDNQGNKISSGNHQKKYHTGFFNHTGNNGKNYKVAEYYEVIKIGGDGDVMVYPRGIWGDGLTVIGSTDTSKQFRSRKFPLQIYREEDNTPFIIDLSKNSSNITPRSVLKEGISYVTIKLTGYPTKTISFNDINEWRMGTDGYRIGPGHIYEDFTQLRPSNIPSDGIESVLSDAIIQAIPKVIKNSTIAVLPVTTSDAILRDYINGETEYILVNQDFKVVDRAQLEIIRAEQRFHRSGEIDTQTAVDIGKIAGADYIILGQIDSEGKLRLRILDVLTAEVVGVSSVSFGDSQLVSTLSIEDAIRIAIQQATKNISRVARLAIVEVTAENSVKEYLMGESEYMLLNQAFKVVDRLQLDKVRAELSIQHSSEADTRTVAEIGKLAGADYLITIRADGQGGLSRLRWRILDTQTAVVTGIASVPYINKTTSATALEMETAISSAIEQATSKVGKDNRLAVVQISITDDTTRDFVLNYLEDKLVNQGFRLVNRSELDRIRVEQRYQQTSEVDDRTAIDIGKFAGARFIMTGRIDGSDSLRRLRLRILDTQTAEVVGVASVRV